MVPSDCVLGNSVNFLELPTEVMERIAEEHGSVDKGLNWLAVHLNSETLDLWSRACLLYTSPSPRDQRGSRMPSSA